MTSNVTRSVLALGILVGPGAARAATSLTVGNYEISSYYVSATGSNGGTCLITAGSYLSSVYSYPGPNKNGATARAFLNGSFGNYVLLVNFPTTPPAGATTWSGKITETILPGGSPAKGTFSSSITQVDNKSYVSTTTYVLPAGSGTCTSVVQEIGVWAAK